MGEKWKAVLGPKTFRDWSEKKNHFLNRLSLLFISLKWSAKEKLFPKKKKMLLLSERLSLNGLH